MGARAGGLRFAVLALVAVAIWFAGATFDGLPAPQGREAPPTEFSAVRALATLGRLLGPQVPHPVSSPANRAVRDRVRAQFAALGIQTRIYRGFGCEGRSKYGFFACGTAEDILADVAPGTGKAIVLMAHYDSVPAGPGASDDQSGVATILETVRALKARGMKSDHPILALITDGEEAGLLGADAFASNAALRARVGAVVNVEARGSAGPSLLIQTGEGSEPYVDLYGKYAREVGASSLVPMVYKVLPNDTDFTVFLDRGLGGFNFAFAGNVAVYHTPQDRIENLSLATLQFHGDNLMAVTRGLMATDFAALKGGDAAYNSLFGMLLPPIPVGWTAPIAFLALLLLATDAYLSRGEQQVLGRRLGALAIAPAALVLSAAIGWLLHTIAALVSGQPDPSYAHPIWLRIAIVLGIAAALLPLARIASARLTALTVWYWMAFLAFLTGLYVPGLSPFFLYPVVVASLVLAIQAPMRGAWTGPRGEIALFVAALPALATWLSLAALAEAEQGLAWHPLITVPMAFGAMTLLPLMANRPLSRAATWRAIAALGTAALVFSVVAGLVPAFSKADPQRLNIAFIDDHIAGKGEWAVETGAALPAVYEHLHFARAAASSVPLLRQTAYVAPAGATRFAVPSATVSSRPDGAGRAVTIVLRGSPEADRMAVVVPKEAGLLRAAMGGRRFLSASDNLNPAGTVIACVTADCRTMSVTLTFAARKPVDIIVGEQRYGLPPDGARYVRARPDWATASQSGDTTIVFGKLRLP